MPVLGSGHPQADVFLLKYAPAPSEIEEGVAFYGRSGTALMKSLRRLDIDPLAVYGTLCVKCPVADTSLAAPECLARLVEEIAIVQPKIVVVMGDEALATLNELALPLARTVEDRPGAVQALTPVDRRARGARHRRRARRGGRQARLLDRLPRARRVVGAVPAVLTLRLTQSGYGLDVEEGAEEPMLSVEGCRRALRGRRRPRRPHLRGRAPARSAA